MQPIQPTERRAVSIATAQSRPSAYWPASHSSATAKSWRRLSACARPVFKAWGVVQRQPSQETALVQLDCLAQPVLALSAGLLQVEPVGAGARQTCPKLGKVSPVAGPQGHPFELCLEPVGQTDFAQRVHTAWRSEARARAWRRATAGGLDCRRAELER